MNDLEGLQPGLKATVRHQVDKTVTARHMLSGAVEVLATPILVAYMEEAAVAAITDQLPPGATSVGMSIDVQHLAPTPVGMEVRITATLTQVEGRRLTFDVLASDEQEEIGRANHQRVVVDMERFMEKAAQKRS